MGTTSVNQELLGALTSATFQSNGLMSSPSVFDSQAPVMDPTFDLLQTKLNGPISNTTGINLYSYVGENPTNHVDPLGLQTPNTGAPNTWFTNPGSGQMRFYGPDGNPALDIDSDHDHGAGCPHMHVWLPNPGGFPIRGPGLPMDGW